MRCAKMCVRVCVPGLRGANSSLWTRQSPPESLSHPSSCSSVHPESITHHLYLRAPNSITPPMSVSNSVQSTSARIHWHFCCRRLCFCLRTKLLIRIAHNPAGKVSCFIYSTLGNTCYSWLGRAVFPKGRTPGFRPHHKWSCANPHIRNQDPF